MTRSEFTEELKVYLSGLDEDDINSTLDFYCEMIDERMDEGMSEEEAVFAVGTPEEIANRIKGESENKTENTEKSEESEKTKKSEKKRMKAWEIILLVIGSPLWISLGAATFAVIISLYAVLWSLLLALYAVTVSLAAGGIVSIFEGIMILVAGGFAEFVVFFGVALLLAGLAILAVMLCRSTTDGVLYITVKPMKMLAYKIFRRKA